MKNLFILIALISTTIQLNSQQEFIQIETNKTLCLFSFLETASNKQGTSSSFHKLIFQTYGEDDNFHDIVNKYGKLHVNYTSHKQEYPDARHNSLSSHDLLWIAASNSKSIQDFSTRIIGYLPQATQSTLIACLKDIEPYYNKMIWNTEQKNIKRIEDQLNDYKEKITESYLKISTFYKTTWDDNTPFKIMLYPIPLKRGNTTAIPKGNALICGFLSHNDLDYQGRLGVIIHEMCHILYGEQTPSVQHDIDSWFNQNESPYSKLAYNYIDEGLATVLGNGWAYKQIHGEIDTADWYNDVYINGFGKALLPLVDQYMEESKSIDQTFVNKAIEIFENRFPKAIYETKILMNSVQLFTNTEKEDELDFIANNIHSNFNIRSMWLSSPIDDEQSKEYFKKEQTTKVFIVHTEQESTIGFMDQAFPSLEISTPLNSMDILYDEQTKSPLIIIHLDELNRFKKCAKILGEMQYLKYGINIKV